MRRLLTITISAALLATACGGDGDASQPQTEEGAIAAVKRASEGTLRGNAGAILGFLSDECRAAIDEDQVRLAARLAPAFFEDMFEDFDLGDVRVEPTIREYGGDTASVEVAFFSPDGEPIDEFGLSSETIDIRYENGKWVDEGCEFEDTSARDAEAQQEALDALGYAGTQEDPIPLSVGAPVGDGFTVSVDAVQTDAASAVEAAGGFLYDIEAGHEVVLVTVTIGYFGTEEPQSVSNVSFQLVGGTSRVGVSDTACGDLPELLSGQFVKLFTGAVTTGDICLSIDADEVDGMLISAEGGFGDNALLFDPQRTAESPVPVVGTAGPSEDGRYSDERAAPTPLGETVDLGEGWSITVEEFVADAGEQILAASDFNEPAPDGKVYSLLRYALAYSGTEEPASPFSVEVDLVGDSNVAASRNCPVSNIPDQIDRFAEIFSGGTLSGNECFVVDAADLDSIVVFATADFFGDNAAVLAVR